MDRTAATAVGADCIDAACTPCKQRISRASAAARRRQCFGYRDPLPCRGMESSTIATWLAPFLPENFPILLQARREIVGHCCS